MTHMQGLSEGISPHFSATHQRGAKLGEDLLRALRILEAQGAVLLQPRRGMGKLDDCNRPGDAFTKNMEPGDTFQYW